ncbi:MAG: DUF2254 family protein [Acidobacteriota bacterium]
MSTLRKQTEAENRVSAFFETIRRAFAEFLLVPTGLIAGFLLLALGSYALDSSQITDPGPVRSFLKSHIFANSDATSSLLAAIAAGVITMTSITISLLLIAVQQSASSMTGQVYDQFLRRKVNQIYFGYFIGLALFSLVTLATVNDPFNPVFGATIAFLATMVSLYLLILLLYTTINQMRPIEIIETIHEHILAARSRQAAFLRRTRSTAIHNGQFSVLVRTQRHGFLTHFDLDRIDEAAQGSGELILLISIGAYVAFEDVVARVCADTADDASRIADAVAGALRIERQRDIAIDPAYGIEQLEMIGWTSISTAKSNPAPGLFAIQCLRDVMARWSVDAGEPPAEASVPVVYVDDVFDRLLTTFETFAVVSSESMQHQIFIETLRTFTIMFDRLPTDKQDRAEDLLLRILSVLGDHVLTAEMDAALLDLSNRLELVGRSGAAEAYGNARQKLLTSVGEVNSRSTRV